MGILFGSLVFPLELFTQLLSPLFLLLNISAGILLISKKKKLVWFFLVLFAGALFTFGKDFIAPSPTPVNSFEFVRMGVYFLFFATVTYEIILQVWKASHVNKNVIIGLMCGYVSLGLVFFFVFLSIEMAHPGSFEGPLITDTSFAQRLDSLLYYSYITLLTIGYGEIIPVTQVAQKAAILTGLAGQFYLVIITAVVVEKYIRHNSKSGH